MSARRCFWTVLASIALVLPGGARWSFERLLPAPSSSLGATAREDRQALSVPDWPTSSQRDPVKAPAPVPDDATARLRVAAATADRAPLAFERSEWGGRARYRARGAGYAVDIGEGELRLGLASPALASLGTSADHAPAWPRRQGHEGTRIDTLRMTLVGARPAEPHGAGPLDAVVNYLIGDDPAQWRLGIPLVGRVVAPEVYPGIDVVYYGNQGRLQYDFLVRPGADLRDIRLEFPEATRLRLTEAGDLELQIGDHALLTRAPVLYQQIDGVRRPVAGRFALDAAARQVAFDVEGYDATRTLVIDPVLDYGTYFSSTGTQTDARAVGLDSAGNIYFGGTTNGAFGAPAKPSGAFGGSSDAYLAKFNAAGQPVFTTYFGGSGADRVTGLAANTAGEVVIGGQTSSANLPGAGNPAFYDSTFDGGAGSRSPTDGFVAKFTATGTLAWMSYIGGDEGANSQEEVSEVALDPSGAVIVAATALGFPGPVDGVDTTPNDLGDLLVVKFSAAGARLAATWLGTNSLEQVFGLAIHGPTGDVIVSGLTYSSSFPFTAGAYQTQCTGSPLQCAYLVRLSSDLKTLRFATYFGSQAAAYIDGIAVDADNSLVLVGGILANSIGATPGTYDTTHNGSTDAFLARMTGDGRTLSMLTYLGGAQFDAGASVAIDAGGQIYVAGSTGSAGFPVSAGALRSQLGGTQDGFLAKFLPDGSALTYSTLIGSTGFDFVPAVTVTPMGDVYFVGQAGGSGLAVSADAFDAVFSQGVGEAFLYRLSPQFDAEFQVSQTTPVTLADAVVGAGTLPGVTNSTLAISGVAGVLDRIDVSMYLTHAVRRHLQATLIGPSTGPATQVVLFTTNGVQAGANFGTSCATRTVLSDAASNSILFSTAPSAGTFTPANALSSFEGRLASQINGTWTLRITDNVAGTSGTLQCWGITFYFRSPAITSVTPGASGVPAPGSAITMAGSNFVAGATVRIGGLPATVRDTTSTLISAVMPAGVGSSPHVAVTNPDGRSAFAIDPFNRLNFTRSKIGSQRQGEAGLTEAATLQPVLSRNGRWLAFKSFSALMIDDNNDGTPDDTNGQPDIFVRDRGTGGTRIVRISEGLNGQQANGPSDRPRLSADGRFVAFVSGATNLVIGDTNGVADVFVHDRDADADGTYKTRLGQRAPSA